MGGGVIPAQGCSRRKIEPKNGPDCIVLISERQLVKRVPVDLGDFPTQPSIMRISPKPADACPWYLWPLLLESTTQIWSRTRLRVALGARPQSLSGSRVSLWHDRPEKFSVGSRVAVAGYGARVPTQRLSLLRRYKLGHAPETRRSCRQGRSVGCLATERSVQRA